jgi:hypothetical protein
VSSRIKRIAKNGLSGFEEVVELGETGAVNLAANPECPLAFRAG